MAKENAELTISLVDKASEAAKEISSALNTLFGTQSKAADGAEKINKEIDDLNTTVAELKSRKKDVTEFSKTLEQIGKKSAEINKVERSMAELKKSLSGISKPSEKNVRALEKQQKTLVKLKKETDKLKQSFDTLTKSGASPTDKQQASFKRLEGQISATSAALEGYNTRAAKLRDRTSSGDATDGQILSLKKLEGQITATEGKLAGYKASVTELNQKVASDFAASVNQSSAALERNQASIADTEAKIRDLNTAIAKQQGPDPRLQAQYDAQARKLNVLVTEHKELEASAEASAAALRKAGVDAGKAAAEQARLEREIKDTTSAFGKQRKALKEIETQNKRTGNSFSGLEGDTRRALGLTQRIRGEILALAGAYVGLYGAIDQVRKVFSQAEILDAAEGRFRVSFDGDTDKAVAEMQFVRSEADRLKLSYLGLVESYSKFSSSLPKGLLSLKEQRQIFKGVATASRVLRISTDDVNGIFNALTQSMSKGTIQAEELKGQIGDRLPAAVQTMAEALNDGTLSTQEASAELFKMMENGDLAATLLVDFGRILEEKYGKEVPNALNSTSAAVADFENAVFDLRKEVSDSGFLEALTDALKDLTENLKDPANKQAFKDLGTFFGELIKLLPPIINNIRELSLLLAAIVGAGAVRYIVQLGQGFLTLASGIRKASGAAAVLRTAFAFLAGPGALIVAAGTAFAVYASAVDDATLANRQHLSILDKLIIRFKALIGLFSGSEDTVSQSVQRFVLLGRDQLKKVIDDTELAIRQRQAALKSLEEVYPTLTGGESNTALADIADQRDALDSLNTKLGDMGKAWEIVEKQKRSALSADGDGNVDINVGNGFREASILLKSGLNAEGIRGEIEKINQSIAALSADTLAEKLTLLRNSYKTTIASIDEDINRINAVLQNENLEAEQRSRSEEALSNAQNAKIALLQKLQAEERQLRIGFEQQLAADLDQIQGDLLSQRAQSDAATLEQRFAIIDRKYKELISRFNQSVNAEVKAAGLEAIAALKEAEKQAAETQFNESSINDLLRERAVLQEQISLATEYAGTVSEEALSDMQRDLSQVEADLNRMMDSAIAFANQIGNVSAARELLLQKQQVQVDIIKREEDTTTAGLNTARENMSLFKVSVQNDIDEINNTFKDGIGQAFVDFARGTRTAGEAFRDFAASVLEKIADMILQQGVLNRLFGQPGDPGGAGGLVSSFIQSVVLHDGGLVGAGGTPTRSISPSWFANAPRFHSGGLPGLNSSEVPAILQRGEEVITRDDPRNILNGGGSGTPQNIKVINTIDSESVVSEGLNSASGEQAIINVVRANRESIKTILA